MSGRVSVIKSKRHLFLNIRYDHILICAAFAVLLLLILPNTAPLPKNQQYAAQTADADAILTGAME